MAWPCAWTPWPPTSTIASLTNGQYIQAPSPTQAGVVPATLIIGGSAFDADAGVEHVIVIVDNVVGMATGKETWTYPFSYLEGHHTIQAIAVDNVGFMEAGGPVIQVIADGTPPQITVPAQQLIPQRNIDGRWTINLAGEISDPPVNDGLISPGSGVNPTSVLVSILTNEGSQVVQPADLAGSGWSAVIEFPAATGDPTGAYTVTVRAADNVGNQGEASGALRLDVARVTATISQASAVCDTLIKPGLMTGVITGSMGLKAVDAAFLTIDQTTVLSETALILPLDEPAGEVWFEDATLQRNAAHCVPSFQTDPGPLRSARSLSTPGQCPIAGKLGGSDAGVYFDGKTLLQVPHDPSIDFDADASFSVQAWIKTSATDVTVLSKRGLHLHLLRRNQRPGVVSGRRVRAAHRCLWPACLAAQRRRRGGEQHRVDQRQPVASPGRCREAWRERLHRRSGALCGWCGRRLRQLRRHGGQ